MRILYDCSQEPRSSGVVFA